MKGAFFIRRFFPDEYHNSIFEIDTLRLKEAGKKGLLIDLDNTMVARNENGTSKELKDWLIGLKERGFLVCIVSNNWKLRVSRIADELSLPLVARATKPSKAAFLRGMKALGTVPCQTAVIGDQIFTDIYGGNRLGLYTILVVPLSGHELFHTKILRRIEGFILQRFQKEAS
ncbi:MAG: YqeG family HAD IIIA-type phosphatase [Actinomycetota bacterium]|nr:YqeG family HAD IIIA-type phosphatase [Actinomycetota bacterium]